MNTRHCLTDWQWSLIADLFPARKRMGRPPMDRRQAVNGIIWILRTGAPWRELPAEVGKWSTVWDLFDAWNASGLLDQILNRLRGSFVEAGLVESEVWHVDGTIVRAARCAAGGGKKGIPTNRRITPSAVPAADSRRKSI